MYERLKVFMEAARSNRDLDAWDADHQQTIKGLEEAVERLKQYRDSQGFVGETANAMNAWVDRAVQRINAHADTYRSGHNTYQAGRLAMASALHEANLLSPTLLDSATEAMRDNPVVMVPSSSPGGGVSVLGKRFTTGAAYVDAVEAQANAQREAAATRILERVNSLTGDLSSSMQEIQSLVDTQKLETDNESSSQTSVDAAKAWADSASHSYGRSDGRNPASGTYPGGFAQPWWSEADAAAAQNRTVASGAVPTQEPAYGETGSRTNPITDPQELMGTDLLHTAVNGTAYRNGVVGGHTPAPPADVDHPLWRLNGGAASDSATAGRLGGAGVLGAGALGLRGAARMGSGSFGGSSVFGRFGGAGANGLGGSGSASGLSSAGRMGAAGMRGVTGSTNGLGASGAAGLKVGSYSGSGFGSYTPPAGAAGANGPAGSSGVTGTTGANGGGAAGAAGAAGKGGTTSGGFMGAGAGAGAGAGKDDKKGRKNRYVAFKFDDDEDELPAGYVNPLSQTSGTDKDIAPAKRMDDGWDPRQW
ncbi:hypothetical protein ACTODO_01070 [Schaalia dentiphila ATCC 17982]|uniref:Uncharacterized protein n=2 Tax=Schaalia TaxID=2529408 RepID=A7BBP9_9ACTO|nr:hypothetical protein ACTODO_01070 [Schaalia odontolytica ATCC 17982]